ncbi:hypothetical protein Tco_1530208 [Tanacetum coccineum]
MSDSLPITGSSRRLFLSAFPFGGAGDTNLVCRLGFESSKSLGASSVETPSSVSVVSSYSGTLCSKGTPGDEVHSCEDQIICGIGASRGLLRDLSSLALGRSVLQPAGVHRWANVSLLLSLFLDFGQAIPPLLRRLPHRPVTHLLEPSDTPQASTLRIRFTMLWNANVSRLLNLTVGGNFLDKMPRECLRIIESKSKVRNSRNKAVVAKKYANQGQGLQKPDDKFTEMLSKSIVPNNRIVFGIKFREARKIRKLSVSLLYKNLIGDDDDEIDAFLAIDQIPIHMEGLFWTQKETFTGELITIPLGIVREHEDYINRMSLLCSNSSSQSPENSHTIIESLPTSTTLVEDSDPNREEIDIFSGPDDSIPPGVESDFDSEEDIIDNFLNNDFTHERLTFNIEPDAPVINNFDELNEDECFDPGGEEIDVEVDDSFTFVTWIFLPFLTYPEVSPLLSSFRNEDTIYDPDIST